MQILISMLAQLHCAVALLFDFTVSAVLGGSVCSWYTPQVLFFNGSCTASEKPVAERAAHPGLRSL